MEHINTLKAYKDLIASGMPQEQAEAQVLTLNSSLEHVATKSDLKALEVDIKNDIKHLERDLKFFMAQIIGGTLALAYLPTILKQLGWL